MRFCPDCGKGQATNPLFDGSLGARQYGLLFSSTLVLFGVAVGVQSYVHWKRGDLKPTKPLEVTQPAQSTQKAVNHELMNDPELVALRKDLEQRPGELSAMKALATGIGVKLRNNPEAPPELVFEAIDLLGTILKSFPEDPEALVMMADVSFDQKAFSKALEFYERYLKVNPKDLGARARYASTMTFIGRFEDSIRELNQVLSVDPKNFPAMAYLAITWAQKGDLAKARELGVSALEFAPSDEARARFSSFMSGLDEAQNDSNKEHVHDAPSGSSSPPGTVDGVSALVDFVKGNPVAGPKFSSSTVSEGTLTLSFKDFPMQNMPPFAKDKFLGGIKAKAAEVAAGKLKTIVFVDSSSNATMETISLP